MILILWAITLAGCRSSLDPFCRAHSAADFAPARQTYEAMSPAERRAAADQLNDAARRCGWEP